MSFSETEIIQNVTIVTHEQSFLGAIVFNKAKILSIITGELTFKNGKYQGIDAETKKEKSFELAKGKKPIDATGLLLLPGAIDTHVHFRDPGLKQKATFATESKAAIAGGVTSVIDMPNTNPQTTDFKALAKKMGTALEFSYTNYGFMFGATNENAKLLPLLNPRNPKSPACTSTVLAVKLFMGASTGNMLVDQPDALDQIFANVPKGMPIVAHCEDSNLIAANAERIQAQYGEDPEVCHHAEIRNEEVCYNSTKLAVEMARKHNARLHVAHISTAKELGLFNAGEFSTKLTKKADQPYPEWEDSKQITCEACLPHIVFTDNDYATLGTRIKCNPAIKTTDDREAIRAALKEGVIDTVATDHAPHLLSDKEGGCIKAASGIPSIQFSLLSMLELVNEGVFTLQEVVKWMCYHPARLYHIAKRGELRRGFKADFVLIDPNATYTVDNKTIVSKCKWSPFEGKTFHHKVVYTFVNGTLAYSNLKKPKFAGTPLFISEPLETWEGESIRSLVMHNENCEMAVKQANSKRFTDKEFNFEPKSDDDDDDDY